MMVLGLSLLVAGAFIIITASTLSRLLAAPNEKLGARPPTSLSFVLVGIGFVIVGLASMAGWI